LPYVPELRECWRSRATFNKEAGDELGGIFIIELKAFLAALRSGDELDRRWSGLVPMCAQGQDG